MTAGPSKVISTVGELSDYIHRMGSLHDCEVESLHWKPAEKLVEIRIKDINAGFKGLPEYEGAAPCAVTISGVNDVILNLSNQDARLMIYDAIASEAPPEKRLKLLFSSSGSLELSFTAVSVLGLR